MVCVCGMRVVCVCTTGCLYVFHGDVDITVVFTSGKVVSANLFFLFLKVVSTISRFGGARQLVSTMFVVCILCTATGGHHHHQHETETDSKKNDSM